MALGPKVFEATRFFLLQGMWPGAYGRKDVARCVPASVLGNMLGNAMSAGVLRLLAHCIFKARGIK